MPSFEEAWTAIAKPRPSGESVSPELRPLLLATYTQIRLRPADLDALKKTLQELLEFLKTKGRTNANCWAVDLFFALSEGWEYRWREQDLPEDFRTILAQMGRELHNTVMDQSIADVCGCLPEQLLERVSQLKTAPVEPR